MQYFVSLLHKDVSLDYADFKPIYSEHFIRYHERREKDVLEALETLYGLYGYVDTRHRKKINGNNVIDIYRARLRINNAEIHIKTYRPKKFNSPASSLWDHPKIEAVCYFTKSEDGINRVEEIEQLARDLIATIVEYANLKKDLLKVGINVLVSGSGYPIDDVLTSIRREYVVYASGVIDKILDKFPLLIKAKARAIIKYLSQNGPSTSYEIASHLRCSTKTAWRYLKLLKDSGLIFSFRNGNKVYYALKGGDRVEE